MKKMLLLTILTTLIYATCSTCYVDIKPADSHVWTIKVHTIQPEVIMTKDWTTELQSPMDATISKLLDDAYIVAENQYVNEVTTFNGFSIEHLGGSEYLVTTPTSAYLLDLGITFQIESHSKYNSVNMNDVNKGYSLGIIQFNAVYAGKLAEHVGVDRSMTKDEIRELLSTDESVEYQHELIMEYFILPVVKKVERRGVYDTSIIQFLVDWRVNGCPSYVYKNLSQKSLDDLISLRNKRYRYLHKLSPNLYTKKILTHWLERTAKFN